MEEVRYFYACPTFMLHFPFSRNSDVVQKDTLRSNFIGVK